jgi:hypothetical protein
MTLLRWAATLALVLIACGGRTAVDAPDGAPSPIADASPDAEEASCPPLLRGGEEEYRRCQELSPRCQWLHAPYPSDRDCPQRGQGYPNWEEYGCFLSCEDLPCPEGYVCGTYWAQTDPPFGNGGPLPCELVRACMPAKPVP